MIMKLINNDYRHNTTGITTNCSIPNPNWSIPSYVWNTVDLTEYEKAIEKNKIKKEEKHKKINMPKIKNIDFQPPLTIVVWDDGTKTFVKCAKDEVFDPEKGAAMAIAKKALSDKYNYIDTISYYVDKWLKKDKNRNFVKVDKVLKENKEEKFTEKENKIISYLRDCEEDREEVTDYILDLVKEIYWNR